MLVTVGCETDWAATMGKALEVELVRSEVVETVRRSAFLVGAGDSLVTPSSSTVTAVLAPMVAVEPRKQMATLSVGPMPQLPMLVVLLPTVTLLLTSDRTLVLPGSVIVIWLSALPDNPPVADVMKLIV